MRLVAALVSLSLSACVTVVPIGVGVPTSEPAPAPETHDDDHTVAIVGGVVVGIAATTLIAILVKRSRDIPLTHEDLVPTPATEIAISSTQRDAFARGFLAAQHGECDETIAIGDELARTAPAYHAKYLLEPTIAACVHDK